MGVINLSKSHKKVSRATKDKSSYLTALGAYSWRRQKSVPETILAMKLIDAITNEPELC
jgi:hypothetical protein